MSSKKTPKQPDKPEIAPNFQVWCAHDALIAPESLKPNPRNPNRHPSSQIATLAHVIRELGWRVPITVSKRSGLIVRGHGRLQAALLLGANVVPVDFQDYASDQEELADVLADNKIAELSALDEKAMKAIIEDLRADPNFDLQLTGLDLNEIDSLFASDDPTDVLKVIPAMELQAFEHYDYLVFLFRDLRDFMWIMQAMKVPEEVDYNLEGRQTTKIGLGRCLNGERLIRMVKKAQEAGYAGEP